MNIKKYVFKESWRKYKALKKHGANVVFGEILTHQYQLAKKLIRVGLKKFYTD